MRTKIRELTQSLHLIRTANDTLEERVSHHKTTSQYFTIAYLFIQSLIGNTLFHFPTTRFNSWSRWVPLTLSLSITFLYFVPFVQRLQDYLRDSRKLDHGRLEEVETYRYLQELQICQPLPTILDTVETESPEIKLFKRKLFIVVIVSLLLLFTAIVLYVCLWIPWSVDSETEVLCHSINESWSFKDNQATRQECGHKLSYHLDA